MKSKEQKRKEAIERQKEFDKLTMREKLSRAYSTNAFAQIRRYKTLIEARPYLTNERYPTGDVSAYPNGKFDVV